jgi:hypothetical protein
MFRKLWRDALDGGCRDDEHTSSRPKNRHADRRATSINNKAALGALPQAQIKFDPGVDVSPTQ